MRVKVRSLFPKRLPCALRRVGFLALVQLRLACGHRGRACGIHFGVLLRFLLDGLHACHLRDVVHHHILDAALQCDGRARAPRARALQLHEHNALVLIVAHKGDVAAVLLHGGPDSCLDELLDHGDHLRVIVGDQRVLPSGVARIEDGLSFRVEVHDALEDVGLHHGPRRVDVLRDGDEIFREEHRLHAIDLKQTASKRRGLSVAERVEL
mmetsp:Transcript_13281/g.45043  ORF Transcript_13281/g.45043 Transcript_13281/m.45043 type:complete len:210 (-) Transcript_13281:201-830(-)